MTSWVQGRGRSGYWPRFCSLATACTGQVTYQAQKLIRTVGCEMMTPEMKQTFAREGFLAVEGVFTEDELIPIRAQIDALIDRPDDPPEGVKVTREGDTVADKNDKAALNNNVRGAACLVRFMPFFQEVARHRPLLECARGLLGPRVKVFRDQALFKPPGGQAKPPHQDQSYFRVVPENDLVTAWIALEDATRKNGCMRYVPQSHTHGVFPIGKDPDRPVHHVPLTGERNLPDSLAVPVPAGSVIFHHGCTLHHSDENRSDRWRKAIIFHFTTSDAMSEHDSFNEEVSLEID